MSKDQKIIVKNNFQKSMILCIEPWATEYGMLPNDEFKVFAEDTKDDFYFCLVFDNERITIFVEGESAPFPQIYQDGKMLDYGQNLR